MKFGERLKAIRKRSKKTQQTIADHLNITLRTYQRYEEGTIEPPLSAITALSEFLDIPTDCLIGNGLFSNWEDIIVRRESICEILKSNTLGLSFLSLDSWSEGQFARALAVICKKIEITEDSITIHFFDL